MESLVGILILLAVSAFVYYSFHLYVRAIHALEKTTHNLDRVARNLTDIIEVMKREKGNS